MASLDDCRVVVHELAAKLGDVDPEARKKHIPDRTLQLTLLLDLDVSFEVDSTTANSSILRKVKKRASRTFDSSCPATISSRLTNGDLNFAHACMTGRIRLDASLRDLFASPEVDVTSAPQ